MPPKDTDKDTQTAKALFEHFGYSVVRIPPDNENQRADLRVTNEPFIVEVKSRIPSPEIMKRVEKAPMRELTNVTLNLKKSGSMSNDYEKANEQLAFTREGSDKFGCLLIFLNPAYGLDYERYTVRSTLLGERLAFIKTTDGKDESAYVLYAGSGDFFRYRDIDCAIWFIDNQAQLLCNTYSPRIEAVRQSDLYKRFVKESPAAVTDPGVLNAETEYVVDSNVDRKDEKAVCAYLASKYKHQFIALTDLRMGGGVMKVPNQEG